MADEEKDPARYRTAEAFKKYMEKSHGKGVMVALDSSNRAEITHWCSTSIYMLDDNLGWGVPGGRFSEWFGAESCLASDTKLTYYTNYNDGTDHCDYYSIEHLYHRFHHIPSGTTLFRKQSKISGFTMASMTDEGRIVKNVILDVVKTGKQECFRVTTVSGQVIEATKHHRFFVGSRFVRLSQIEVGDIVYIHNNTRFTKDHTKAPYRKEITVKHHPVAGDFMAVKDVVLSIESVGIKDTYDIKMAQPYHNYIAARFVVHNSGKTTTLQATMVENEYRGGVNYLADPEGTFNEDRYKTMGGDPTKINLLNFDTHEQFYDILNDLVQYTKNQEVPSNALNLIAVDTMTMLIPSAQLKADADEQLVALQARINSRNIPKINKALSQNTAILMLSQIRDKVGEEAWGAADANIETPGGHILKHISSTRVFFNKMGQIDNGKTKEHRRLIGMKTAAKVVKNKVAPPLRKTEFNLMFDERGVDSLYHALDQMTLKKVISKQDRSNFTIKGEKLHIADIPKWFMAHPKWVAWALEQTFELYHPDINLLRYLSPEDRKKYAK